MRTHIAITIIITFALVPAIFGLNSWPFFSYPMYSYPIHKLERYEVWADVSSGNAFRVRDSRVMYPIGPNGMNEKIRRIIQSKNLSRLESLLRYLHIRLSKKRGLISRLWIKRISAGALDGELFYEFKP